MLYDQLRAGQITQRTRQSAVETDEDRRDESIPLRSGGTDYVSWSQPNKQPEGNTSDSAAHKTEI